MMQNKQVSQPTELRIVNNIVSESVCLTETKKIIAIIENSPNENTTKRKEFTPQRRPQKKNANLRNEKEKKTFI